MWLEEAAEADARLALMRWGTRGRVQLCAAALANASRRLRRLLIEGVHAPTYHELRPAIGSDLSLLRALASRGPHLIDEVPLAVLVRSMLGAPGDPWISMIARRIGAVTAPDAALAPLVPELVERCQAKIANIDRVIAELRALDDPSTAIEREELDDLRDVYERTLEHAARLLVH